MGSEQSLELRDQLTMQSECQVGVNALLDRDDAELLATPTMKYTTEPRIANRYSVGFRLNRVATIDDNSERDLIKGDFENWGVERGT